MTETLFEIILQNAGEGIAVLDSRGIIIKHNLQLTELLHQPGRNLSGIPASKFLPQMTTPDPLIFDFGRGQSARKLLLRGVSARDQGLDYQIIYLSSPSAASIQLYQQFEETRLLKDMYEKIINSIDEGIHSIDTDGKLRIYNTAQENLEGYRAEDVLGKHLTEIYNLDQTTSLLLKVLQEGQPIFDYHQEYTTKNGQYIDVVCSTVPLYSGNTIVGSAAILRDFSKFRKMAEKILDLQEKLTVKWSKTTSIQQPDNRLNFDQILGENLQFAESIDWAKAAARTDSPVFIVGETGTGKEMFAQSIHEESHRVRGPFLAINCAAIPESLLEGILFGTIKGAFTGAVNRVGLLEQASGGSLFLDEINSMPLTLQAKLLRVLEEKRVRRLGGHDEVIIDTRVISSCNVLPADAIGSGQIRSDLFYRLAVVYINIPPLRERMDDLELLAEFFIRRLNKQLGKEVGGLRRDVMAAFKGYHWPGNVRQLKHTIECAMNIIPAGEIFISPAFIPKYLGLFSRPDDDPLREQTIPGPPVHQPESGFTDSVLKQIKDLERETIISALKRAKGNVSKAAADLEMSRQLLQYHLKRMGLK